MPLGMFKAIPTGRLEVHVRYQSKFTYSLELSIVERKIKTFLALQGATYELPAGTYTLLLKGLLADPIGQSTYHKVFKDAYGSFQRSQKVTVPAGGTATCTFDLPGETYRAVIVVTAKGQPLRGAEVLVQEVDPNFHVTRGEDGAEFYLEPGLYQVVIAYGNSLVKEVIRVEDQEVQFTVDLEREAVAVSSSVVVRFKDGRTLKGTTTNFSPLHPSFTVQTLEGDQASVTSLEELKAVFFVKSYYGNREYDERKDFAVASQFGKKTILQFFDQEELWGYTLPGHTDRPAFFLFPVDPDTNNTKVYVVKSALTEIRSA